MVTHDGTTHSYFDSHGFAIAPEQFDGKRILTNDGDHIIVRMSRDNACKLADLLFTADVDVVRVFVFNVWPDGCVASECDYTYMRGDY